MTKTLLLAGLLLPLILCSQLSDDFGDGNFTASPAWTWDGLGERGERLPVGTYNLHAELLPLGAKNRNSKRQSP